MILAGGRATRFPGKLERHVDGEPMLLRVYRNARATGLPVYVAAGAPLSDALATRLDVPVLLDRWPYAGPLRALLSACEALPHARMFAVAGDEPRVGADGFRGARRRVAARTSKRPFRSTAGGSSRSPRSTRERRSCARRAPRSIAATKRCTRSSNACARRFVPLSEAYFVNVNTPQICSARCG